MTGTNLTTGPGAGTGGRSTTTGRHRPQRRSVRVAAMAAALSLALTAAACGGDGAPDGDGPAGDDSQAGEDGWSFTDDQGTTHTLDHVPETIVAQSVSAGGLWEYGIEVAGVFGPLRYADGRPDPSIGLADPDDFTSVGEVDTQVNIEALAALRPDIIVTTLWGEDSYWGIDDSNVEDLRAIAPIVAIRVEDRPMTEPLARFVELAESLGAEPDRVTDAEAEFQAASDRLAAALEAKPGLQVLAASGSETELFVAWPPGFGDLAYYQQLGMELVEPDEHPAANGYWQTLSWERADTYPADLVLVDVRAGGLDTLLEMAPPSARALPAAEADQMVAWPAAFAYGYGAVAANVDDLAAQVEGADADVV